MTVTIAVVDDDKTILDAAKLVLEAHGWRVRNYATGDEFLANLNSDTLDCVVLDPHLAALSGQTWLARLPTITISSRSLAGPRGPIVPRANEVVNAGARVMLTKPVTAETLVGHIQAALSGVD